ncbi:MAG: 3'-5' exonuclease domain-containing protein 2 [Bacteroidales bacterium]|nr:3'-5' exonuclease domain-containing protein 2 [Bacteroidales bacterium]
MKSELKERPTRAEIAQMPLFAGLPLESIEVLRSEVQCEAALARMRKAVFVGFDTESKPTFTSDAVRDGPHVIQFALPDRAYIVQVDARPPLAFLRQVLESDKIIKVGFGLKSDRELLYRNLGIRLDGTVELTQVLRQLRYRDALGLKAAVAVVLGQQLHKPKSVTTSNWAAPNLSARQLLYAANDAYASLAVFLAMDSL